MTPEPSTMIPVGVCGLFDDARTLARAAERFRDAGFRKWDCHTPYPVHGLDKSMGLYPSPIPLITLGAGFLGGLVALGMQWWMSVVDYPLVVGGKPHFSWPAFVPIIFELAVLFAAGATMAAILFFCRLGRWHSPLHDSGIMAEVTRDRFAIVVYARDRHYDEAKVRKMLASSGCDDIRPLVERPPEEGIL